MDEAIGFIIFSQTRAEWLSRKLWEVPSIQGRIPEEVALEPESRGEPVLGADGTVWSRWVVEVWGPDMEGGPAPVGTARHAEEEVLFHTGHQERQHGLEGLTPSMSAPKDCP